MEIKKNILIVGYPKSGTNWLSRLVAEVLQCDFLGDWGFDTLNASRIERNNNASEFQVYKSHHTNDEIKNASKKEIYKIIYIVRDPRDIVISGAHFFSFPSPINSFLRKVRLTQFIKPLSMEKRKKEMIKAVLFGNKIITPWLEVPWVKHYQEYLQKEVLFIKYEDLLKNPENEIENILNFLDLAINPEHIKESIYNQSFDKRQKEVLEQDHTNLIKLVRKGETGYWKNEFTEDEKKLFKNNLMNVDNLYNF